VRRSAHAHLSARRPRALAKAAAPYVSTAAVARLGARGVACGGVAGAPAGRLRVRHDGRRPGRGRRRHALPLRHPAPGPPSPRVGSTRRSGRVWGISLLRGRSGWRIWYGGSSAWLFPPPRTRRAGAALGRALEPANRGLVRAPAHALGPRLHRRLHAAQRPLLRLRYAAAQLASPAVFLPSYSTLSLVIVWRNKVIR
jgi:hypothetical protein